MLLKTAGIYVSNLKPNWFIVEVKCRRCSSILRESYRRIGYCDGCLSIISANSVEPTKIANKKTRVVYGKSFCPECGNQLGRNKKGGGFRPCSVCNKTTKKDIRREKRGHKHKPRNTRLSDKYLEYMGSPEWQVVRRRILKIYNYKCAVCGIDGILDIHHRNYKRFGRELDSDLVALCRPCHDKIGRK